MLEQHYRIPSMRHKLSASLENGNNTTPTIRIYACFLTFLERNAFFIQSSLQNLAELASWLRKIVILKSGNDAPRRSTFGVPGVVCDWPIMIETLRYFS